MNAARDLLDKGADAQARLGFERVEGTFALVDGDPLTTYEIGVRHFEETPFAPGISVSLAVLGAALLGDLERLQRAQAMAESLPSGVFNTPAVHWAEVAIQLAQGDVDGGLGTAEELLTFVREHNVIWQEFVALTTIARMLPDDHEARGRYLSRIEDLTVPTGALGLWEWAKSTVLADH
jgi:hypothetical protein